MSELAERVERVRLLLATLHDPYPQPRSALVPDAGPAPSRYVPCESCLRRGEVRVRSGWMLCLVCDGRGWKRREDEPEWDAYLELPLVEAAQLPRPTVGRRPLDPELEAETYGWERLLASYDKHGSYAAIRQGLSWLSEVNPNRFQLVSRVHVLRHELELSPAAALELELGVVMLTLRVGRVRVPPWLIERTAADERRASVLALAADGYTPGQIARRLGLPKRVVQRKLRG